LREDESDGHNERERKRENKLTWRIFRDLREDERTKHGERERTLT